MALYTQILTRTLANTAVNNGPVHSVSSLLWFNARFYHRGDLKTLFSEHLKRKSVTARSKEINTAFYKGHLIRPQTGRTEDLIVTLFS